MADVWSPLVVTLVESLYTSPWPNNPHEQKILGLKVYRAHGHISPVPAQILTVKNNFVNCLRSDTPPAWITEDAELLRKFKAIVKKVPNQQKLKSKRTRGSGSGVKEVKDADSQAQRKRALSMPEFKIKKVKIEDTIDIKGEPNFDYTAETDGRAPIPCRLDPESEDEIIEVGEIYNEHCKGVVLGPDDCQQVPYFPKSEPEEPPSREEPRIKKLFRIVDGYRCYYDDDELAGCAHVASGCIRAEGYQYWSDLAKRNHTRRDELERQVHEIKHKAQTLEEARKRAAVNGRRAAAKRVLAKPARNLKKLITGKHLKLGPSLIHGNGLYALEPILKGERVIEYVGDKITLEEADERERMYMEAGTTSTYFFQIGKTNQVLDATKIGNNSRYINHSCNPNCSSRIIANNRIMIVCNRDIEPGEEITYDYKLTCEEKKKKIHCLCGEKNCRSYMNYDEAEWNQMQMETQTVRVKKEAAWSQTDENMNISEIE